MANITLKSEPHVSYITLSGGDNISSVNITLSNLTAGTNSEGITYINVSYLSDTEINSIFDEAGMS